MFNNEDRARGLRITVVGLLASVAIIALMPTMASAQSTTEMQRRMIDLEQEMKSLKVQINDAGSRAQAAKREAEAARRNTEKAIKKASLESVTSSKWHLAGYMTANFTETDAGNISSSFGSLKFNPIIHYQYSDFVLFEGEIAFELEDDGTTKTSLEYASIDILAQDWVTIVAGQFLSPVGQFQERLHPGWINKLPDAPAGFGHGGAQPLSDLGVMARGGVPVSDMILSYSVAVGNGPRVGHHGPELEAFGTDDNNNKAVSGRVGIQPMPHLEIGASFLTAQLKGEEATSGPVTEGDYDLWGVDVAFTKGAWDIRAEYLKSKLGSFFGSESHGDATTSLIPSTEWEAWYVQLAYQLSGITKTQFVRNLELVARYGEIDVKGHGEFVEEGSPEKRYSLGVNYLFAPAVMLKTGLSWREFKEQGAEDAVEFKAQIAYGF